MRHSNSTSTSPQIIRFNLTPPTQFPIPQQHLISLHDPPLNPYKHKVHHLQIQNIPINQHPPTRMSRTLPFLRIAPVLLTTSSLTFSFTQYLFHKPYLTLPPQTRPQVNNLLRDYIHQQFPSGLATILVLYPLTWATAIANLTSFGNRIKIPPLTGTSRYLYLAGLVFNVGHMLWAPRAKALMEEIGGIRSRGDVSAEGDNVALLGSWLRLHVTRSILADFPSWVCFTAGFLLTRRVC